jgi:hypothetical protein
LLEQLNQLSPEQREMILAQIKQESGSNSQLNSKKPSDRYMDEEKDFSSTNPFSSNQREDRPYRERQFKPRENYPYKEYNQESKGSKNYQDYGYSGNSNWSKKDDRYEGNSNYKDNYYPKKNEERPARQVNNRDYNYEEYPQHYRQINNPGEQVWRGQQHAVKVQQPEKQAQPQKRQTDAILDNIRTREDVKSIHMIFTKIKGQRYIETIDKDLNNDLDPKSNKN